VTACLLDSRITACLNEDGRLDEGQLQRPYWPISGHRINGTFGMLDWFDPGLDKEDLNGMHTTLTEYAIARLKAQAAALRAYRDVNGTSYHLSMLTPGMQHTEFTDLPCLIGNSETSRSRHLQCLRVVRRVVVAFFDSTLRDQRTFLRNWNASDNEGSSNVTASAKRNIEGNVLCSSIRKTLGDTDRDTQ